MERISEVPYRRPLDETAAVDMGIQCRLKSEKKKRKQGIESER
jgi:hypothetical protein